MNLNSLMKQAQNMQKKLAEVQEKIVNMEFAGASGGGVVTATVDGKCRMKKISLDPSLMVASEKEILEDLIIAAYNEACKKAEEASESEMGDLMGGMGLPAGFKMPF